MIFFSKSKSSFFSKALSLLGEGTVILEHVTRMVGVTGEKQKSLPK